VKTEVGISGVKLNLSGKKEPPVVVLWMVLVTARTLLICL